MARPKYEPAPPEKKPLARSGSARSGGRAQQPRAAPPVCKHFPKACQVSMPALKPACGIAQSESQQNRVHCVCCCCFCLHCEYPRLVGILPAPSPVHHDCWQPWQAVINRLQYP